MVNFTQLFVASKWRVSIVGIAIVLFLTYLYGSRIKTAEFDVDEYHFIRKSFYYDLFFVTRNIADSRWTTLEEPRQPKIGTYLYGLNLHLNGSHSVEETLSVIDFSNTKGKVRWWEKWWMRPLNDLPQEFAQQRNIIEISRSVGVFFSIFALLFLFLFLNQWIGLMWSTIAVLLISINGLMVSIASIATTDSMQLCFFFLSLFLMTKIIKQQKNARMTNIVCLSVVLGLSLTGAVGVKVSGIISLLAVSIFYLLFAWLNRKTSSQVKRISLSYIIVLGTFSITFIFLHPYLYSNPPLRFIELFTDRLAGADLYRDVMRASALRSRTAAIQRIAERTLLPNGNYLNFYLFNLPIDLVLFLGGMIVLIRSAKQAILKKSFNGALTLLIWNGIVFSSLVYYLRNDWPRYYLPSVVSITITQVYFLKWLTQQVRRDLL